MPAANAVNVGAAEGCDLGAINHTEEHQKPPEPANHGLWRFFMVTGVP
jgi:hypothetical protein